MKSIKKVIKIQKKLHESSPRCVGLYIYQELHERCLCGMKKVQTPCCIRRKEAPRYLGDYV